MFEHRLLEARKRKGLTQKQVAEQADIHVASYSAYENNHKVPPVDILLRIANVLDVSLDWLSGREQGEAAIVNYGAIVRSLFNVFDVLQEKCSLRTGVGEINHGDWVSHEEYTKIVIWDPVLYHFFTRNTKFKELTGEEDQELYSGWLRDKLNQLDRKPILPMSEEVEDEDLPF